MDAVTVEALGGDEYRVTVSGDGSSTAHTVAVDTEVPSGVDPADLVAAAFRFLLDREPKESILSRFDLSVIERYFPEYPQRIDDYL